MASVVKQFLEQARLHPERIAVLDSQGAITYDQMNNLSAYMAKKILDHLGGRDRRGRVALLLPRARAFVVAQFAVLRAGCAIVPIDAEYPAERVQAILQDVGCALCVTVASLAEKAAGFPVLQIEEIQPIKGITPTGDRTLDLSDPDAEGYILYTSGSTGKPKGVVHRQEMLGSFRETYSDVIRPTKNSRTLCVAGFSFIAAILDIMPMLTQGDSVYIANETERKNMDMIWHLFERHRITGMFIPPKMYDVLRRLHGPLPLEYVLMGGEKCQTDQCDPGVYEGYASTESGFISHHPMGEGGPLSLGKPSPGVSAYLLDEDGRRITEPGIVGELCVSSPWLATGYNNRPEETAQRFTDNPFHPGTRLYHTGDRMAWDASGNLLFYGRNDRMVKVRGYRVELGEIERVMTRRADVDEAASVEVRVHGGDLICCYYTGGEISPEALKAYAADFLPEYMVPEYFVHLETLPRNERGKVDYPCLKAMEIRISEAEYEAPATETEQKICAAVGDALGMDRVSARANFFDQGGTSLSAAILIDRLSDEGFALSFQDVSAHPTPRDMAAFLHTRHGEAIPALDRESYPLTRTQMGIYLESLTGGS